ncbi:MAG: anti-sigma factor antagonist [Kibdelosporangium sp.]
MTQNLRVTRGGYDRAVVVSVAGEIDIGTVSLLQNRLRATCQATSPPRVMVVDLRSVEFFGAAGISALLTAEHDCQAKGVVLYIVADHQIVLRPLQIAGLSAALRVTSALRLEWVSRHRTTTPACRTVLDATKSVLRDHQLAETRKQSCALVA